MQDTNMNSEGSVKASFPISAHLALGEIPSIKEPILLDNWLIWLEQRPLECGRTTALLKPWGSSKAGAQELTPAPINLRTRIHVYGGGPFAACIDNNYLYCSWINDEDGCLWSQTFIILPNNNNEHGKWVEPISDLICLSRKEKFCLGGGLIDCSRKRWIGCLEHEEKDFIVSFRLDKVNQKPEILHSSYDFSGYLALNPTHDQLAWIEWRKPYMPWESSQLCAANINENGCLYNMKILAGSDFKNINNISVFQPFWLDNGKLVVAEDSNGWWNLIISEIDLSKDENHKWERLFSIDSESGMPQWVYGMSTASSAGNQILSAQCRNGLWELNIVNSQYSVKHLKQPFQDLAYIHSNELRAVAVASNSVCGVGLLEIDLKNETFIHQPVVNIELDQNLISKPQQLVFSGYKGKRTYAWYYPPSNGVKKRAPLLVKSHSGPTAMASIGLNLSIQFWTSRGWGVVDVNYGGSSGFGREYRDRLKGNWGLVDAFDCEFAAKSLISGGQADQSLIAIEGGSAGGFTTLSCLSKSDIFRVASCKYGVSDLTTLAEETHRFEEGYLDYLLGPIEQNINIYQSRSPLYNVQSINCPVIFFQGLKDNVVLPNQTSKIANSLKQKNIQVELHTYPDEGHGFKNPLVKIEVLEKTEKFFNKHLGL